MAKKLYVSMKDLSNNKEYSLALRGFEYLVSLKLARETKGYPEFLFKGEFIRVPAEKSISFIEKMDSLGHVGKTSETKLIETIIHDFRIHSKKSEKQLKLTNEIETVDPTKDWDKVWIALPTIKSVTSNGNSLKKFSKKVWLDLMLRENQNKEVCIKCLTWIDRKLDKSNKDRFANYIRTNELNQTWKERLLKVL